MLIMRRVGNSTIENTVSHGMAICKRCCKLSELSLIVETELANGLLTAQTSILTIRCHGCGSIFDVTEIVNDENKMDFELLLQNNSGRKLPLFVVALISIWALTIFVPFVHIYTIYQLGNYKKYIVNKTKTIYKTLLFTYIVYNLFWISMMVYLFISGQT